MSVATSSLVEALGAAGAMSADAEVARARVDRSCMVAVSCWCLRAVAAVSRGVAAVESWRRGGRVVARSSSRSWRSAPANSAQRGATARTLQCARGVRTGHRTVPLRCSTSPVWHSCDSSKAVTAAHRAASSVFARSFRSRAVKSCVEGAEPLCYTNGARCDAGTRGRTSLRVFYFC